MRIVAVQHDIVWENKAANCAKVRALLEEAAPQPGAMIVLAEMFATGFSMNLGVTLEGDSRPTERFVGELARRHGAAVVAGVVNAASPGRGFNEAVAIGPEGELARYRKMQPFCPGGEHMAYDCGRGAVAFQWQGATVCPFVCYDLRFPEVIRRAAPLGAEVIAVIASWPVARIHHWIRLLQARAIENQCWVVGVNRIGVDPTLAYCGRSIIVDHHGEIQADAGDKEGVISAEVNLEELRNYRQKLPFLKDRKERSEE